MFNWKVRYLNCCGASTVYEVEENYTAWTKWGVWNKFWKAHDTLPTSYTDPSHFQSYFAFRKLVTFHSL